MAVINCPKCGAMFSDEIGLCPECGYDFETPETPENEGGEETVRPITAIDLCSENDDIFKNSKITKSKQIIDKVGYFILIAAVMVTLLAATNLEGTILVMAQIATYALIVIALVLTTIGTLMGLFIPKKKMYNLLPFAQGKETSLMNVIGNTLNVDYTNAAPDYIEKQKEALANVIDSERYYNYEKFRKSYRRNNVFNVIMNILISIVLCVALIVAFNYVFSITSSNPVDGTLEYVLTLLDREKYIILALAIVVAIMVIVGAVQVGPTIKKRRAWVAANFPEQVEVYDKYVKYTKKIKTYY